ncbi:hypothetical protein [Silicimonas sp. MF1-12-2]|uniref:hypothetical protein n=1 Tax=Silicimonas sp. MF1-12-2 TaxID=3384793 RepID=UPI0039B49045
MTDFMRTFLTTLLFLAFLFAAIAVPATMMESAKSQDVIIAILGVAGLIYLGRHAYLIRFGRLGLLKPRTFWKPLKPEERGSTTLFSAADGMAVVLGNIARQRVVDGATPDDELRSERNCYGSLTRSMQTGALRP